MNASQGSGILDYTYWEAGYGGQGTKIKMHVTVAPLMRNAMQTLRTGASSP